ncbi:MAG TPA: PAS domain S-box protein [Bryobacteraceae bacterium]|nr:PAS domain S-box protein [Bryobacteraceae bacterium]
MLTGGAWFPLSADATGGPGGAAVADLIREVEALAGIGVWEWDLAGDAFAYSERCARLHGLPARRGAVSRARRHAAAHPEDRARLREFEEDLRRGQPREEVEFRVVWPDGSVHHLVRGVMARRQGAGGAARLSGFDRDMTPAREAERAAREAEERYASLFRAMKQGVYQVNAEGVIVSANPAAAAFTGLEIEEISGLRRVDHPWPEFREDGSPLAPEESPALIALRTGKEVRNALIRLQNARTREDRWISVDSLPLFRPGEARPYEVYSIAQDVTALKLAETEARAQKEILQTILDHIPVFVAKRGADGRFQFVNRAFQKAFGWALSDGKHEEFFARVAATPEIQRAILEHAGGAGGEWRDLPGRLEDGTVLHSAWRVARLADGSNLAFGLDLTPRVEAEERLRAEQMRFRLLVEHSHEVVGILDEAGVVQYMSPPVVSVMGRPAKRVTGGGAFQFVHPEDVARVRAALERVRSSPDGAARVQFRFRHADGSWRHAESMATNALHVEGLNGIIVNFRDITPQKDFERQLSASRDQLRNLAARIEAAREQERIRMAREIHDELGQMLSALKLDLEALPLKYRPEGAAARKGFAGRIAGLGRQIAATIDTVRRISAELRPGVLDHLGLAAALRWQVDEFTGRTGIRCRCRGLAEHLSLAAAEATTVFRIFQEILTNILRHAAATAVTVDLVLKPGWLTLRVADNGKGIDPARISDPHSLGLLGMRERALTAGGEVRFAGRRGGGTVVALRLPRGAAAGEPRGLSRGPGKRKAKAAAPRILLADDHEIFRKGLRAFLEQTWPDAVFGDAASAAEAVEAARQNKWDLLILDLSLPDKSGMAVVREITELPESTPILVLSMHAGRDWARQARRMGAAGYVNKSAPPARIRAAVAAVLAGRTYEPS